MKFLGGKCPNLEWQKVYIVCYNNNYSGNGENVCIKGTLHVEMHTFYMCTFRLESFVIFTA